MSNRTKVLNTLQQFFKEKGRVLTSQEYSRETDTPIRIQQVRNVFGSWNRMEKLLMARDERVGTDEITDIKEVLAARNRTLYEADKQWREASENQDAKARRQAEAQHVAEVLALNAATPEGANANKIAIGGPLPSEQTNFQAMGATVKIDPVTKEQTVVNPEPEIFTGLNGVVEDPRTPNELRDAIRAGNDTKTGTVPVGHATDGGSQGKASIATVSAIGGTEDDAGVKSPTAKEGAAKASK